MIKTIEFYILSFISIVLQFIFLSILKEFNEEFLKYIEITILSQIIISILGSIQFYIESYKNQKIINIQKNFFYLFSIIIILISFFYIIQNFIFFLFFITALGSMATMLLNTAYFARFNLQRLNTYYVFVLILLKTVTLYIVYIYDLRFYYSIILINIISMIGIFFFTVKFHLKKRGFSIISLLNNFLGTSLTTIDKLYCNKFLSNLSADYFIIFKIASFFQYLTEVIYRKERFEITSGIKNINQKNIFLKFITCFFFIGIAYLLIKNIFLLEQLFIQMNMELIYSLFVIIENYALEFVIISLAFLINSISGLKYDYIYKNFSKNKLLYINLITLIIFIILIIFSKNILELCLSFILVHVINFLLIGMYYIRIKKHDK